MFKIKKIIVAASLFTTILSLGMLNASAATNSVESYLDVSYHIIPILKDTADASTTTNVGYNGSNLDKLWVYTTVTATSKSGSSSYDDSWGYGNDALEGKKSAVAKIRYINKADSKHIGGNKNGTTITKYRTWNR